MGCRVSSYRFRSFCLNVGMISNNPIVCHAVPARTQSEIASEDCEGHFAARSCRGLNSAAIAVVMGDARLTLEEFYDWAKLKTPLGDFRPDCLPNAARRWEIYRYLVQCHAPARCSRVPPKEFEADAREAHLYHWTAEAALQVPALRVAGNELRTQGQLSGKATMQASGVLSS